MEATASGVVTRRSLGIPEDVDAGLVNWMSNVVRYEPTMVSNETRTQNYSAASLTNKT